MRKSHAASLAVLLLVCSYEIGAQEPALAEPQTLNIVYHIDPMANKLVSLERQTAQLKSRVRKLGFGGASSMAVIKGQESTVRLEAGKPQDFVVRLAPNGDPGKFHLYLFEAKDGTRQVLLAKVGIVRAEGGMGTVSFDVSKFGEESYKFTVLETAPAGQYCFSADDSQDVFCFGLLPQPAATPNND